MPEEEIDRMIENGDSENIFQKAIMDTGRGRVMDTLAEIQVGERWHDSAACVAGQKPSGT